MERAEISLRRLLPQAEAKQLLASFASLMPGQLAAVLDANGHLLAQQGASPAKDWPDGIWLTLQISPTGDLEGQPAYLDGVIGYPLCVERQTLGWLVVDALARAGAALQSMLVLLLKERIEKRRLARETLERYREVNLLYHLAERFGSSLEVGEILQIALSEARRVIPASCGIVWLTGAAALPRAQAAYSGSLEETQALENFLLKLLGETPNISMPNIVTDLGEPGSTLASVMYAPLRVRGALIGVLALGKTGEQSEFNAGEEKLLLALAEQAAGAVEKAELHQQDLDHQRMAQELAIGQRIQRSLLPRSMPVIPGWEFAASYQAANLVGGDFYDIFSLPGETGCEAVLRFGLTIADVAGKGIPAALMMAFSQGILHSAAFSGSTALSWPAPGDVLYQTNQSILQSSHSGLLLTAFYAVLDPCTGHLSYANGGHEPPMLYRAATGEYQELICGRSLLLGAQRGHRFAEFEVQIAPGDLLLLYTDGVTEARDPAGAFFGEEHLCTVLAQCAGASCSELLASLNQALTQFTAGAAQSDDITLLAIRRLI